MYACQMTSGTLECLYARAVGGLLRDSSDASAHCRVGACVSVTERAVFVDGAAAHVEHEVLASSSCDGCDAEAADAAASVRWAVNDVLSVLIDVDNAYVHCWRQR